MSARAIWKGSLSVGLVTLNIKVYKATDDPGEDTSANLLHNACKTQINKINKCAKCDKIVDFADIVKGVQQPDGSFVVLTPEDYASIQPANTNNIIIDTFVPFDDIDPLYVRESYFLTPDGAAANVPYVILMEAMKTKNRAAQGVVTISKREQTVTIAPINGGLMLQLMRTKTEVRDATELPGYVAPGAIKVDAAMLTMANQLIDNYKGDFDPTDYEDGYVDAFKKLVEAKKNGTALPVATVAAPVASTDLMTALRASLTKKVAPTARKAKVGVEAKGKSSKGKKKSAA